MLDWMKFSIIKKVNQMFLAMKIKIVIKKIYTLKVMYVVFCCGLGFFPFFPLCFFGGMGWGVERVV